MGGKSQTQTQTGERNPWGPANPLLKQTLGGLDDWLNSPMAFQTYGGPTVAQMSDQTRAGLDGLGGAGGMSRDYLQSVMGGKYLDAGNPYMEGLKSRAMADVMPAINASFAKSGMGGSTLHQGSLARGVGDALAPQLFQSYENERNRQMGAAQGLFGMDRQASLDQIMGGQMREGYDQRNLDAARMQWEQQRLAGLRPYQEMFPMLAGIAGMGGTTSGVTTTRENTPWWQQALGGGMMGLGLMSGIPGAWGGFSNMMNGAPMGYGNSWTPWTRYGQ